MSVPDDDYMNAYDRPPKARTIEDAMRPRERLRYRNSWHTEPSRWERLRHGMIQLVIIVGSLTVILGALWWSAYWNGKP